MLICIAVPHTLSHTGGGFYVGFQQTFPLYLQSQLPASGVHSAGDSSRTATPCNTANPTTFALTPCLTLWNLSPEPKPTCAEDFSVVIPVKYNCHANFIENYANGTLKAKSVYFFPTIYVSPCFVSVSGRKHASPLLCSYWFCYFLHSIPDLLDML